ncbi:hypothetical protein OUZ56_002342 [Daphnia magna]|uniref:Uncharacterized protein n=1 Tax=Daphnia magna TaxID=35525 RepID=A0ABR0A5E3_9CRUS|nr:hypothetical protein OUZ56_002342 [Daphnia magna]
MWSVLENHGRKEENGSSIWSCPKSRFMYEAYKPKCVLNSSLWSSPADIRNNQSGSFALAMIYNVFNEKQMEACILINAYTYDYADNQA